MKRIANENPFLCGREVRDEAMLNRKISIQTASTYLTYHGSVLYCSILQKYYVTRYMITYQKIWQLKYTTKSIVKVGIYKINFLKTKLEKFLIYFYYRKSDTNITYMVLRMQKNNRNDQSNIERLVECCNNFSK